MTNKEHIKELEIEMRKGIEYGRHERELEIARILMKDGVSLQKICKYTGLPESVVKFIIM